MKKSILLISLLFVIGFNLNAAPAKKFGIGISAGQPTGISMKYWLNPKTALEGVIGYSVYNKENHDKNNSLYLHLDYLLHHNLVKQLYFTYGLGGRIIFHEDAVLGFRIPLGITYLFTEFPLDASFDLVPVLNIIPETDFDFEPSISLRFNF